MPNVAEGPWRHGEKAPDRTALRGVADEWSYGRLRERIAAIGGEIRARGIAAGDRVLLVAPSVPEFVAAYSGLHAAGATIVAMNPMATATEISYVLADSECRLAMAWTDCAEATETACGTAVPFLPLKPGADEPSGAAPLTAPHPARDTDTAVILYTSGTTGRPKGAELTHSNLLAAAEIVTTMLQLGPADAVGTALPLFHVFGGSVMMGAAMSCGASLSLRPRFEAAGVLEMIERDRLTVYAGVPTMYNALARQALGSGADLSSLRVCLSGGAPLPDEVLRVFDEELGVVILEGYGLTECTGVATFTAIDRPRKPGCVGVAVPQMEVRVVAGDGSEVGPDEVGEVIIRGPAVMKGYRGRPEASAETVRDGWLRSGDLGAIDAEGDLRIVDRIKDLIIRGGYNVYPREVEEVLYTHPDIVEAAVVGIDDERLGEEVGAVVALRAGAGADGDSMRAWTKERLSPYKVPRFWQFVDALPKGATGKILKRGVDRGGFTAAGGGSA